jgi:hypothetical protein
MMTATEMRVPAVTRTRAPTPRRRLRRSTIADMAAYATLSKSPLFWGEQAAGVQAVIVTDGRQVRGLGSPELVGDLLEEPFAPGDPVQVLRAVCANTSYLKIDGPFVADGSLDEVLAALERDYQLPLVNPRT